MKPTPIFVAAAGFAMIGACTVKTEDNSAENTDGNTAVTTPAAESTPPANVAGETDTLGNQLDQLNQSDGVAANETENSAN
jgi:hypothetical protein